MDAINDSPLLPDEIASEKETPLENFYLFWVVTCCGILAAFVPILINLVVQVLLRETKLEFLLRRQACDLKAELGSVSMVNEFVKYAKIQRKFNKVAHQLSQQGQEKYSYSVRLHLVVSACLYGLTAVTVICLLWWHHGTPLLVVPQPAWLQPLSSLLSPGSHIPGALDPAPWMAISLAVGRRVATSLV